MAASASSSSGNLNNTYDTTSIWTTLLTNRGYLAGLLVLDSTIKKHGSRYQLVVMLSGAAANDPELHATLEVAGIPVKIVEKIEPAPQNGKINKGTWEKLAPWNFTEYEVGCLRFAVAYEPSLSHACDSHRFAITPQLQCEEIYIALQHKLTLHDFPIWTHSALHCLTVIRLP